jgi:hypothetical protein
MLFAALAATHLLPANAFAATCTTEAAMQAADHDALVAAGTPLANAIAAQNFDLLQSSLLPAVTGDWESLRGAAQAAAPVLKGGQVQWRSSYLLDASDLKAPADTQFFCTSVDSSLTVTINLRNLPQGRYALLIGDFPDTPLAGQLALILGAEPGAASAAGNHWKLGGLFVREGMLDGHDGIWYWTHARELTPKAPWSAWFSYDLARWLLLPMDFISTPNLDKLNREQESLTGGQSALKTSPQDSLPLTVNSPADASKSWKIIGLRVDMTLHASDLGLTYEGTGLTDPQAARAEAVTVMSAFLKLHPELRESFHGLWAYAEKDGRQSYAIELAMHDIP